MSAATQLPLWRGVHRGRLGLDDAAHGLPDATRRAIHAGIEAQRGRVFTADMVRDALDYAAREVLASPLHANALAGVMTSLAKSGAIEKTGVYVRSQRDARRGAVVACWRHRA